MSVLQTPQFRKAIKRLHANQKSELDKAVREIMKNPASGQQKTGDLSWLRVFKFRMVGQMVLLAYELAGKDTIILHDLGSHENFYRDLKSK